MPPHAPPYKLVHVLTHAYLVPEPCAHPRRTSTGRGNHRAAAWRALVQRYLSAQKGANFDGKKSDSKRGRIRAQRLPTQRGSYPRVRTAQESSPHMVGPRLKGIPTIRSDPPSGLLASETRTEASESLTIVHLGLSAAHKAHKQHNSANSHEKVRALHVMPTKPS